MIYKINNNNTNKGSESIGIHYDFNSLLNCISD